MGRMKPEVEVPESVREEIALAQTVEEAVARVAPAQRVHASDTETAAVVEQVLTEVAATGGPAPEAGPATTLPIVFLDALEVTQEVQDLAHSVPLIAEKATIVRVYLRYAPGPVEVRGELRMARSPFGPWQTVASVGPAQLDPSRSGGSLAELRTRRANLDFSLNFRVPANLTTAGTLWLRMAPGPVRRTTGTPLASLAWLPVRTVTFRQAVPMRMRL